MTNQNPEELQRLLAKERKRTKHQRHELRSLNRRIAAEQERNTELRLALRAIATGTESNAAKELASNVLYELPGLRRLKQAAQRWAYAKTETAQDDWLQRIRNVVIGLTSPNEKKQLENEN